MPAYTDSAGHLAFCALNRPARDGGEECTCRNQRIVNWTRAGFADATYDKDGSPNGPGDASRFEDEVWWGVWRLVGGETDTTPDAIFETEQEAEAFRTLCNWIDDSHVQPIVLIIEQRDNFEVPK